MSSLSKLNVSNPKVWIVIGLSVAGIVILAETRRREINARSVMKEDFGAFIEKFELSPFPPPAAPQPLAGLTFAIEDVIDVKGFVTGFGSLMKHQVNFSWENIAKQVAVDIIWLLLILTFIYRDEKCFQNIRKKCL